MVAKTILGETQYDIESNLVDLTEKISLDGFCHVRCKTSQEVEQLLMVAQDQLGRIIRHDRSREDGLVPVRFKPEIETSERLISDTAGDAEAHMDGVFMPEPPGVVALGVVELSANSPQTYSIDFSAILRSMPDVSILRHARQAAAKITRNDRQASFTPLTFENGRVRVLYRFDKNVKIDEQYGGSPLFREMYDLIGEAPTTFHNLSPGSVIFFDNHRMLHGRHAFDPAQQQRFLLRGWYPGHLPAAERLSLGVPWSGTASAPPLGVRSGLVSYKTLEIDTQSGHVNIRVSRGPLAGLDYIDPVIFAVKQALGYRHSPVSWEELRGESFVKLVPSLSEMGRKHFGCWLAEDLSILLGGKVRELASIAATSPP